MGVEADLSDYARLAFDADAGFGGGEESDDGRILDWEDGLPSDDDLTPLSLRLVPPELASAFSIPPADLKTMIDVHQATQHTISSLNLLQKPSSSSPLDGSLKSFASDAADDDDNPMVLDAEDPDKCIPLEAEGRLLELGAEVAVNPSAFLGENSVDDQQALKRPRLVWTPQLHKRFVDVVAHLGIKNAVPKTIMQLMNVEGLSRENVASHLQKYRLYLKRMQGFSDEDPSSSNHAFASTLVPQIFHEQKQQQQVKPMLMQIPYTARSMIPMPNFSIPYHHSHGVGVTPYNGFDAHHPYGANNWSGDVKFRSNFSYPHVSHNDK